MFSRWIPIIYITIIKSYNSWPQYFYQRANMCAVEALSVPLDNTEYIQSLYPGQYQCVFITSGKTTICFFSTSPLNSWSVSYSVLYLSPPIHSSCHLFLHSFTGAYFYPSCPLMSPPLPPLQLDGGQIDVGVKWSEGHINDPLPHHSWRTTQSVNHQPTVSYHKLS